MRDLIVKNVKRGLRRFGYELARVDIAEAPQPNGEDDGLPPDFDAATKATVQAVDGFTMTGPERIFALRQAVHHVVAHDIPGAIVECGVWRGGSMMVVARTLLELGAADRDLYLFDTFAGMPEPTVHDVDYKGFSVYDDWHARRHSRLVPGEARASLADVRANMGLIGYDEQRIHYVKGMVEDTIPSEAPDEIAILRLDTDYYESTRHEMFELYPRLARNGVLIIDDYGHFKGSEKAVSEFLAATSEPILLHRVDYSGRVAVKP